MARLKLSTLILILPFIFFIGAIGLLFDKELGPAGLGFVLSIVLFWLVYLRKKK